MIKKLLSAAFFAAVALSATAYEVNDYAYTKVKKFRITGTNLVTNGQFNQGATGTDGWTATDGTLPLETTFTMLTGGPNGSNSQQVLAGQTALTNGMYQSIMVNEGGNYIVSLKVMGATAGFTDIDLTGGNTNYINAYWNTNNVLAIAEGSNNTTLNYGEGVTTTNEDGTTSVGAGVGGGYGFSFDTNGFTEAVFSIDAPAGGYIIIDLRGLNEGLQIADVCCHKAEEVYDDRVAIDRIAYFNKYLVSDGIEKREFFEDFQASVAEVQDALERGATPDEMTIIMDNLEGIWAEFVVANFENVLDLIPTTDGSANTDNNSANWMNWKSKWNKLSSDYNGKAPWKFSTDRFGHKTAAINNPLQIQWQRSVGGPYNNVATLTATLSPGTYYWGVTGQGGMMTLNKQRWARSWANECAETKLFFNGDTVLVDTLNAARNQDYVVEFRLEEQKEITLGLICNTVIEHNQGFDIQFYSPVLYKLMDGEYTEAQKAYIAAANTQLEALAGRLAVAYGYCEAANDTLPWGKEALKAGADEAQARFDAWAALDTTAMLAMMDNDEVLSDTIMTNGVRFLNNNYITPFEAMNKPFTDMPGAIAAAEETMAKRIYSSSTKMGDLQASIDASKAMYAEKLKVPFSSEDSLALVNQRLAMADMVEAFKLAIIAETIVDINFGTQEAPAKFNVNTTVDAEGIEVTTYSIDGAKGSIVFTDVTGAAADGTEITGGSYPYMLGYNNADSLGMLRVGNSEAIVKFSGAPVKATDIVNIKFDWYAGNLNKSKAGYKVLGEAGDTICGLFYSPYDGNDDMNTFGINYNNLPKVGSGSASNPAIAAASNKTAFDIVLDYGKGMMYCTTVSSKGTQVSEEFAIPAGKVPAQFVVYSNYGNADRRCWFDNLLIQNIAAGADTGIESIQMGKPAGDGAIYNIMGQRILKPVKGQIYIQNGVKNIAR